MIETLTGAAQPRRNFYGRRHGKALRPTQRRHLEELLPRLAVPGVTPGGAVDPAALFPGAREIWLEIGFGGGEFQMITPFGRQGGDAVVDDLGRAEVAVEHLHAPQADAFHPFKIGCDAGLGHVA